MALIFGGTLISYVDRGNLSIAAPVLLREFSLSASTMGLLLSAFFWTYGTFQLPAGFLVDRYGVRQSYFFAFVLWSLASASMALSTGVKSMLLLRLLLGLAEAIGPLASLAYIRYAFAEGERGMPVAIYIAGQTVGPACGALLGTKLLVAEGWRFLFAATGMGALLWTPIWLYFARFETVSRDRPVRSSRTPGRSWGSFLANPGLWFISGSVFLFSYYWYFLLTWIPTYLNLARVFPMIAMGQVLSIPLFIMAPFNIAVGWIADRIVARKHDALQVRLWIASIGFIGASSILFIGRVDGRGPILSVLIISVCSFGVASANFWALAQHAAPPYLTARILGYFNTLSQLAGAVAPLLTGYSLGPTRNFSVAIMLAGVSALAAGILLKMVGAGGVRRMREQFEG